MKMLSSTLCLPPLFLSLAAVALAADSETVSSAKVSLPVRFTAPGKGLVSLAIYDANGVLVRSLLSAQAVEAGRQTVTWDATTDLGLPVKAGTLPGQRHLLYRTPVVAIRDEGRQERKSSLADAGRQGRLGRQPGRAQRHLQQRPVAHHGLVLRRGQPGYRRPANGQRGQRASSAISRSIPGTRRCAGAMDETNFYLGIENWQGSGWKSPSTSWASRAARSSRSCPPGPTQEQPETRWHGRWTAWLDGMALTKDTLYASIASDNALFVIDRSSGKILRSSRCPLRADWPWRASDCWSSAARRVLKLRLDGSVGRRVDRRRPPQGPARPGGRCRRATSTWATAGCTDLAARTMKKAAGKSMSYSPQGKLLRTIGKKGGAPRSGRFEAERLGDIVAMCIGPDGKSLWVQDVATGFPRTSRWSLDGKLQRQWFARTLELFPDVINPGRPGELLKFTTPSATRRAFRPTRSIWQPRPGGLPGITSAPGPTCTRKTSSSATTMAATR